MPEFSVKNGIRRINRRLIYKGQEADAETGDWQARVPGNNDNGNIYTEHNSRRFPENSVMAPAYPANETELL